jgi:hypothetical protein
MINDVLRQCNLQPVEYIGDLYNKKQYNYLLEKTSKEKIVIIGDLLNDYMLGSKYKLWTVSNKDILPPPYDRSIVLYYKNEYPNIVTVPQLEFLAFYELIKKMIELKLLKSFNKIKVICRHSMPDYYDQLNCEKESGEIGPKAFELYCNVYANTVFFTTATANFYLFGSRAIVSRNVFEMKKTDTNNGICFDYVYCPIDNTGKYTDGDEFVWCDNTVASYRTRYGKDIKKNTNTNIEKKLLSFAKCVIELDNIPLTDEPF